jgi:O-antigen/teichoic acid export membrane protein
LFVQVQIVYLCVMSPKPNIRLVNITLLNFLARIIFYVFVFVAGWYTARMVSREEFGQLQFITFVTGLSWTFLSFGVPNLLSRYVTQSVAAKHPSSVFKMLTYALWSFVVTLAVVCIGYVFFFGSKEIAVPVSTIILFTITQFLANYFQVLIQSVYRYKTAFTVTLVAVVSGSIFLYLTLPSLHILSYLYTYIGVNVILVMGYSLAFFSAMRQTEETESSYQLPPSKELFRTALYFAVSAILAGILWQRTEFYLLEVWFSYSDIAVYSVAFTIMALFFEPLKLLTGVLTYYYAGMGEKGDRGEAQFGVYFKHFCWIVIFAGSFVWFNSDAIVLQVYTNKYADAAEYLRLLLIGMVPGVCSYVLMSMHIGMGKSRFLFVQDLVCAVVFCLLVYCLTQWMGLRGTAIAKSIAILLSVAMGLIYTASKIGFSIPWKLPLFSIVLSITIGYSMQGILQASVVLLAIKLILSFGLYIVISYFSHMIDRSLFVRVKDEMLKLAGVK